MDTQMQRLEQVLSFVHGYQDEDNKELSLDHLRILCIVAIAGKEGITQRDIQDRYGILQGTVTRSCRRLSRYIEKGKETGYELIEMRPDLYNSRALNCRLTKKGKQFITDLSGLLDGTLYVGMDGKVRRK
jgi:DNA-binding MarR family transcriptional regulator